MTSWKKKKLAWNFVKGTVTQKTDMIYFSIVLLKYSTINISYGAPKSQSFIREIVTTEEETGRCFNAIVSAAEAGIDWVVKTMFKLIFTRMT